MQLPVLNGGLESDPQQAAQQRPNSVHRMLIAVALLLLAGIPRSPGYAAPASQTTDPVLVGAGDIANCFTTTDSATAALLASLLENRPDATIFTAGDNAYPDGSTTDFSNCYDPTWGAYKASTRPAPGNHDYQTAGASAYFNYFGTNAGPESQGYYSYNLGQWHVVSLNSEIAANAGSAQEQWLRADLQSPANQTTCSLAYWHRPLFSSGGGHGNDPTMTDIFRAFYELGGDVVVAGHDHDYERFAPQDPTGQADSTGVREFVVGTGGTSLYSQGTIKPNSQVRNFDTHGVLKFTLGSTSYSWQFVPIAGKTFTDSGTTACYAGTTRGVVPPASMHVGDLDGTSRKQGKAYWRATVTIKIEDAGHSPVASATVSGNWSGGYSGSASCIPTGTDGRCSVVTDRIPTGSPSVTYSVTTVTKSSATYQPGSNHDGDGDSNGTIITVAKPL